MQVCPEHICREDTKLIEADPSKTEKVNCALCGAIVTGIFKSGEWTIQNHTAPQNPSFLFYLTQLKYCIHFTSFDLCDSAIMQINSSSLPAVFRTRFRVLFAMLIALCLVARSGAAQTGNVTGTISGLVADPSGAVISGATIVAVNADTGFSRTSVSNAQGQYEIPLLPIGTYALTITSPGYSTYQQRGIQVSLDSASVVDAHLNIGSAAQTISVTADASILSTESYDVAGGLNSVAVENAPITSRNTFNLALFAPGLNGTRDDEFGNPTFAFGGMQRKDFMIDGIDNTQRGGPGRLGIFSPENVKEIKVISGAMDAEYGRTVGGIINMITHGGSNAFRGEFLLLERRPGLIARPSLYQPTPAVSKPFQQWATYSLNISGPIIHNKLFYYLSGEYEPEDGARPITITPANAAALNLPASELGDAPFKQRFQSYLGRIDYQHDERNDFYFRYSHYMTPSQFNTSGGLQTISSSNNFNDHDSTAATQWSHIFSSHALNELRFGFLQRIFDRPPVNGQLGPVISISGVATLNSNTSAGQHYEEDQYNFIDNFTYTIGRHQLKFGGDVDTIHVQSVDRLAYQYTFASLSQYLNTIHGAINPATGKPYNYSTLTEAFGNNTAEHRTNPLNLFAEDRWQLSSNLQVSFGLRWEYRFYPTLNQTAPLAISRYLQNDATDFAPRVGFTYLATPTTVVRGGYGILYDTLNLRLISLVDRSNGSQVQTYTVNGTAAGAPQYPTGFSNPSNNFAVKPSVYGFAPDFKTQYAHQADLQVEQQVTSNSSITIGAEAYLGRRAPVLIDVNLGAPVGMLADGRPVFSNGNRPNQAYNQIFQLSSIGGSTYYGGFVQFNKRLSKSFQLTTSYTLGWAFNNTDASGDNGVSPVDSTHLNTDYGFSSSDQRHRFVFQGVWQPRLTDQGFVSALFDHWMLSPNATVTSGFPYSAVAGTDLNGDGVNNDYPLFGRRNTFRGPGFHEVNLRVSRVFPIYRERVSLEAIAEAENLLNSTNVACNASGCGGAVVTQYGPTLLAPPANSSFGTATSAFNSRQIQLGGRIRF